MTSPSFPGQRQLAFACHQGGFGGKNFAADFGPGKTGDKTDFVLFFVAVRTVLRNTDVVNYIFRADLSRLCFVPSLTTERATLRQIDEISRSRLRTPASRV